MSTMNREIGEKNKLDLTWKEFDQEVAKVVKYYFDIKIGKARIKKVRSMYNKGSTVSDCVSYILLSNN